MTTLVDTNIVTRLAQPAHPHHPIALAALDALRASGNSMCVVPQVLYEFWTVCTRPPGENGLGLTTPEAHAEQVNALTLFALLPDSPAIFPEWQRLVVQHDVRGKSAHDARLVAAMTVHGVTHLLTFNGPDFRRYAGISVLPPESLLHPQPPAGP